MARNGAGTYTLPAGNPVTTGTTISSTWANNTLNDIASGLTTSLAYDGQTAPVANLPMATYAHTNVGNATVRTMYAAAGQVQDSTLTYLTSVSGTDTITAIAPASMNAYATGQTFRFVASGANTGATTLNINSIGAKSITKNGTTALAAGDITSGFVVVVTYDGTQFQISNIAAVITPVSSFNAGTTGFTPSTATTGAVTLAGTLNVANGGTGRATLTSGNLLAGNGTSAVSLVSAGSAGNVLKSDGTTWAAAANIVSGTAVATTSGSNVDFTGIPSWVKRITIMGSAVVGGGNPALRLGTSSGIVSTGYTCASNNFTASATGGETNTTYFFVRSSSFNGTFVLNLLNAATNTWTFTGTAGEGSGVIGTTIGSGVISLANTLTQVRFLTVTGTFSAGSVNILYE